MCPHVLAGFAGAIVATRVFEACCRPRRTIATRLRRLLRLRVEIQVRLDVNHRKHAPDAALKQLRVERDGSAAQREAPCWECRDQFCIRSFVPAPLLLGLEKSRHEHVAGSQLLRYARILPPTAIVSDQASGGCTYWLLGERYTGSEELARSGISTHMEDPLASSSLFSSTGISAPTSGPWCSFVFLSL